MRVELEEAVEVATGRQKLRQPFHIIPAIYRGVGRARGNAKTVLTVFSSARKPLKRFQGGARNTPNTAINRGDNMKTEYWNPTDWKSAG
jgi:hypothetical protein